uniref:Uncharacterized protein n=1 Tax=Knipowitschia caucasica TaxID=637954 RepID=A0AAV2LTL0_KNICA
MLRCQARARAPSAVGTLQRSLTQARQSAVQGAAPAGIQSEGSTSFRPEQGANEFYLVVASALPSRRGVKSKSVGETSPRVTAGELNLKALRIT